MKDSIWFTTRSALFEPGDAAWEEVARYTDPLLRLIGRRYPWLKPSDREDLVQDILLEMKQKLVGTHDRSRGRFRSLLQTVIKRRVIDNLRKARPDALDDAAADSLTAPADEEVEALDLETGLIEAFAACRDRFTQGRHKDPDVLYALVDRLVHGLSSKELAKKNGVSPDRVARLLRRGRDAIFLHLLARELELELDDSGLDLAVETFKLCLRKPRATTNHLGAVRDEGLRDRIEDFLGRFRAALPRFRGDGTVQGVELTRGIELVLEDGDAA